MWPAFFREHRPPVARVQGLIIRLHADNQHEHVISVIESALINGQSQPWMYEVLALSMELAGRPREQIERVVLSLSDFGGADFSSMMFSAAYLTRFDRRTAALKLYREASKLAPEQPEPYLLGLPHARHVRDASAVSWAACGILAYAWTRDYAPLHHDAENAALEAEQWARRAGDTALADAITSSLAEAMRRDVSLQLTWSGKGDLDMLVEEPGGAVCSFENRETTGGGVLTHDGYGPEQDNCYEEYICTYGRAGAYRVRVRHAWGDIVGRRATLTITLDAGGPEPVTQTQTVTLGDGDAVIDLSLAAGRRKDERTVSTLGISTDFDERRFARSGALRDTAVRQAAAEEFTESRLQMARRAGAVGYQPVIQIIPEGAQNSATAVVSADRRYVRLSMVPLFSNITDVIPFSFIGPTNGNGQ
ncbi:MAG: hypothetical protein JNG89_17220 [Planctomycetaceae bacterium]|nr:hypothetical protein [Planctomycetaceae bacterium]